MTIKAKQAADPKSTDYNVSPVTYVLLTFLIAWGCWGIILLANQFGYLKFGTPVMMFLYGLGGLSPAEEIVSLVMLVRSKQTNAKGLFKRIFNFKEPLILYVIVLGVAALQRFVPLLLGVAVQTAPFYMAILLIPYDLIGGGLEEIGWRFIFQQGLEKKFSFTVTSLITGVVWAVWHVPLFLIEGTHQSEMEFLPYAIWVIGMAFFLAAIYRVSKSVLLCIVFHTMSNAFGEVISVDMRMGVALASTAALLALSFLLIKTFGSHDERERPALG